MIQITVTPQQKETLDRFFKGMPLTEIAFEMNLSYSRIIQILNVILIKTKTTTRRKLLTRKDEIIYDIV